MAVGAFILALVVAFLLGSIPNGLLVGKLAYGIDIRKTGSGNIGTTNAMRAMGTKGGIAVFILDFGKGVLSGLIAMAIAKNLVPGGGLEGTFPTYQEFLAVAFLGCTLGHIFSPWLGFKGGKGIAVAVGCLFVTYGPVGALLELGLFAVLVAATRYVSVGSIAAAAFCLPLAFVFFWGDWLAVAMCCIVGLTVIWAHRANIERLRTGTENRIGAPKE